MTPLGYQKCGTKATRQENKMPGAAPCNVMLYGGYVVTYQICSRDARIPNQGRWKCNVLNTASTSICMRGEWRGIAYPLLQMTPDHQYMLANDLGNNCIWRFQVNNGEDIPILC